MLTTLREASKRGVPIIVFNPLRERGLERFTSPQHPVEMLTLSSTPIASTYYLVKVGGDIAVLKGIMKTLLALDAKSLAEGGPGVLDRDFIKDHTTGIDALLADLDATSWDAIEEASGLSRSEIEYVGNVYAKAKRVIINYGMGITQHRHGTGNVQQIANLLMLRGNIGRKGAGISPLRGHSNVQGDRTVGITEVPSDELLDGIARVFGFEPPRHKGHNAIEADRGNPGWAIQGTGLSRRQPRGCDVRSGSHVQGDEETSISRCTSPPSSIARICWSRSNPSFFPVWGAPRSICRQRAANRSRWRIRCRWSTPRAAD